MSEPTPTTTMASPIQLPDAEALYSTLREKLLPLRQPHTQIAGITSGGAWLAQRLQRDWSLPAVGTISTTLHRDDFAHRGLSHAAQTTLPFEVDGAHILLIDDVLYTGRTIRAALNEIFDFGRPASVQLAVLVDCGGRQLPIEAAVAATRLHLPENQSLALRKNEDDTFSLALRPTSPA
jgi:pyrimidine operon attenuation protein/uracil phosphoribosyltransferase